MQCQAAWSCGHHARKHAWFLGVSTDTECPKSCRSAERPYRRAIRCSNCQTFALNKTDDAGPTQTYMHVVQAILAQLVRDDASNARFFKPDLRMRVQILEDRNQFDLCGGDLRFDSQRVLQKLNVRCLALAL